MIEAEHQAYGICELIRTTSGDRPVGCHSMKQALRETAAWQAANPGLRAMREAAPAILLAFLWKYKEWFSELARPDDYRTTLTMSEARELSDDWKIQDPELVRQFMPK